MTSFVMAPDYIFVYRVIIILTESSVEAGMKIAIVSGGNRGLGLEAVKQLAMKGFKVYLGSRDLEKGQKALNQLLADDPNLHIELIQLDVTKSASIKAAASKVKDEYGHLDVLVNNAGVMLDTGEGSNKALEVDPVIVLKTMEVNLTGPLTMIQAFAPLMPKGSRVINVSSGMGSLKDMEGGWAAYRSSKTALNALTRIFSAELKDQEISVNSICPGWVKTDLGGESAPRTPLEGVQSIIWLATTENPPSGGFFRDQKPIDW